MKLINKKGHVEYQPSLKEDVIDEDSTTHGNDTVPTFLGYAANGNVTAEYVLSTTGLKTISIFKGAKVNVTGKIAIARYGKIFRGLKVKFAQEHGAVGVLIYSDPGDDQGITPANGYKQYPHGPARQESSVQRGSVQFLSQILETLLPQVTLPREMWSAKTLMKVLVEFLLCRFRIAKSNPYWPNSTDLVYNQTCLPAS